MRIVLDTNVLMSAIFFGGVPFKILQAWRNGKVQLAVCPEILTEYREVALRLKQRYDGVDALPLLDLIAIHSCLVQAVPLPEPVCDDPDDAIFFACALAAKARIIVSGDRHLLDLGEYQGVPIVSAREFLERLQSAP